MESVKEQIIDSIRGMTEETMQETKEKINRIFDFMEVSITAWGHVPEIILTEQPNLITENEIAVTDLGIDEEAALIEEEAIKEEDNKKSYLLERKLKGGYLKINNNATVFVPEKVIRSQGLKHGDWIEPIGDDPKDLTYVKQKESETEHFSNRVELDYCVVSRGHDNLLVVAHQIIDGETKRIKLDGETPYQFLVNDSDRISFSLDEGNVVAIAYYKNDPTTFRVVWCYTDYSDLEIKEKPKPSSYYKNNNDTVRENTWSEEELALMHNKKILIVGADFRAADFSELARSGGFILRVLSGDESENRFEAACKNRDVIISLSQHSSHRSSELAKALAKKYDIPFRASPTSISSIKRAVLHGITETEVPFHSFF